MSTSNDKKNSYAGAKSSDMKKSESKETAPKSNSQSSGDTKKTADKNSKK